MARSALWIAGFLDGCKGILRDGLNLGDDSIGVRDTMNGAPYGAYKGSGWYVGLYWKGGSGNYPRSQEGFDINLALGVDVTRVWAQSFTKQTADRFKRQGEFLDRIARTAELLMQGNSVVARACQSSYAEMLGSTANLDGVYREHFDRVTIGDIRGESPEWVGAVPNETSAPETVFVCSLAFSGLWFRKLLSEIAQ